MSRHDRCLLQRLQERAGRPLDFVGAAVEISRLPYRRPSQPTAEAAVEEGCGTCSTKHLLLEGIARAHFPEREVRLWHRRYRLDRPTAERLWGGEVAALVPADGLTDVHTYATAHGDRRRVTVDVTFPLPNWDGTAPLEISCGPGIDVPAGKDPAESKKQLVLRWCEPTVREPFIAALTELAKGPPGRPLTT